MPDSESDGRRGGELCSKDQLARSMAVLPADDDDRSTRLELKGGLGDRGSGMLRLSIAYGVDPEGALGQGRNPRGHRRVAFHR